MLEDGKQYIRRFWEDIFNKGNVDEIDDLFTPDFVLHDLANNQDRSRSDLKNMIQQVRYQTTGVQADIQEQLAAEGGNVVTRFVLRVAPSMYGARSTGEAVENSTGQSDANGSSSSVDVLELNAISISRMEGEQIAETWLLWESLRGQQMLFSFWRWPPW